MTYILLPFSEEKLKFMQTHLVDLRYAAGQTAEKLGQLIGVTRQTINNYESGRAEIKKPTYIALAAIFDYEAEHDTFLRVRIKMLLEDEGLI